MKRNESGSLAAVNAVGEEASVPEDALAAASEHELLRAALTHTSQFARYFGRQVSASDAQDLMQDLYLALLKRHSLQKILCPKAYLFRIAANLVHQHRQRRDAGPIYLTLDEVPVELLESAEESASPEYAAALAERLFELERCLNDLSPKVRAAILWHHRDGYTCAEIGNKLSVVRHRVKKYLIKGIRRCRTMGAEPHRA